MKTSLTIVCLFVASLLFGQQSDKLLHASAGYVSSSITTAVLSHYKVKYPLFIGVGVGTCLGIGKEIYDRSTGRGVAEPMDAVYTIGGAILGSFTVKVGLDKREKIKPNPGL